MTTTEREKCAEILARHISPNYETNFQDALRALVEARDLARREALEEAAHKFTDNYSGGIELPVRVVDKIIRSLISQPSPETASASVPAEPIPMRLVCPRCGTLHLDVGEFATKPHHTHACQQCGEVWQPAIVATVGVEFLPGFKNEPAPPDTEAWKRVPVDAGMLTNVLEQFADVHRPVEVLFTHLYGLAVKIERAARAKIEGEKA